MIDIVMISDWKRLNLYYQSIKSIIFLADARHENISSITFVLDCPDFFLYSIFVPEDVEIFEGEFPIIKTIITGSKVGASRCRNIGASSIPEYLRGEYVLFLDDDIYACPGWDKKMLELMKPEFRYEHIVSGYGHPFNYAEPRKGWSEPTVISSVCMMMEWGTWDNVGFFTEPGGPGGSEDVDYCNRARKKGYGFAITQPQCIIHTGMTSSNGKPIVGFTELQKQNDALLHHYNLTGKVDFS